MASHALTAFVFFFYVGIITSSKRVLHKFAFLTPLAFGVFVTETCYCVLDNEW